MSTFDPAHLQGEYDVRLAWGPTGAQALAGAEVAVVVDVLSFTTSVTVGVGRGMRIWPFGWKDERAEDFARSQDAILARTREDGLSPGALPRTAATRLVLPSPNGSTIAAALARSGATVIAACLRNAAAVARHVTELAPRSVAVIAAGERWPDGSLRPAAEDLWGAGALIAGLGGAHTRSPEAQLAVDAYAAARPELTERLLACSSGRELVAKGYADDVRIAGELDADTVVPVLGPDGAFSSVGGLA